MAASFMPTATASSENRHEQKQILDFYGRTLYSQKPSRLNFSIILGAVLIRRSIPGTVLLPNFVQSAANSLEIWYEPCYMYVVHI